MGMRVFCHFSRFSSAPRFPWNCEYVAEVVRVEELPHSKFGVAVKPEDVHELQQQ